MAQVTDFVNGGYWLANTSETLPAANINATLFSHLFVGYANIDPQTYEVVIDPSQDILINQFSETVRLRNRGVKTLLSIAGGNDVFSKMAEDPDNRDTFIKSSIEVVRAGKFNGLDLRWLYPSSQNDMNNFKTLLVSWRKAIVSAANEWSSPQLLLVVTVSNLPYLQGNIQYPVTAINQNLDWVNILSFDFYTPTSSSKFTGPSSAFHNPNANSMSAHFGIKSWNQILHNLPKKKIVFGIPFHGWAWKLTNSHKHDVFSNANGAATGEYISQDGQIYYSNVKQFIDNNEAGNETEDPGFLIAYTYFDRTWIAYESKDTIASKISIAKSDNVLGYFAFNIAADDAVNTLANAAKSNW